MAKQIVCEVYEYEASSPEEAEQKIRSAMEIYEHPHFIFAASSLDEMPHPMQVGPISKAFGDGQLG